MASIRADRVTVDFPVFGVKSRSFKTSVVAAAIGGRFSKVSSDRVTVRALDEVSFEFEQGDRVGLIGPNGSGKSTLLRVLAGIYEPTTGAITTHGTVSSMLSIFLGMDMEASGYENLVLRSRLMGVPARKLNSWIEDIVEFAGIGDYLRLPMRTYSSGMAMRLAFAVSTSQDADIVLMDEWLSVGDAEFAQKAKGRLELVISGAKILAVASHDIELIRNQCNRIFMVERGKITEIPA